MEKEQWKALLKSKIDESNRIYGEINEMIEGAKNIAKTEKELHEMIYYSMYMLENTSNYAEGKK